MSGRAAVEEWVTQWSHLATFSRDQKVVLRDGVVAVSSSAGHGSTRVADGGDNSANIPPGRPSPGPWLLARMTPGPSRTIRKRSRCRSHAAFPEECRYAPCPLLLSLCRECSTFAIFDWARRGVSLPAKPVDPSAPLSRRAAYQPPLFTHPACRVARWKRERPDPSSRGSHGSGRPHRVCRGAVESAAAERSRPRRRGCRSDRP